MRGTPEQVGSGDVAIECRDPRFVELDAQIDAAQAARNNQTPTKPRKRRRSGPRLPAAVRKEIARFARELRQHRKLFVADPKLKDRVVRLLRSMLPPKRKRGRPGLASVSTAMVLWKKLWRRHPNAKPAEIWRKIYAEAIPEYASMDLEQQKAERLLLRERVRCRRAQR